MKNGNTNACTERRFFGIVRMRKANSHPDGHAVERWRNKQNASGGSIPVKTLQRPGGRGGGQATTQTSGIEETESIEGSIAFAADDVILLSLWWCLTFTLSFDRPFWLGGYVLLSLIYMLEVSKKAVIASIAIDALIYLTYLYVTK